MQGITAKRKLKVADACRIRTFPALTLVRFVVTTDEDTTKAVLFRSYRNPEREADLLESCRIWQACRATSAATTFFPPLPIGNRTFLDGGVLHNNPVELVYREAMDLWPNETPLLVSIGTGVAPEKSFRGDLAHIIRRLKDIATETEKSNVLFQDGSGREIKRRNKYFRFNVPEIGSIGLEEWQRMKELEESTIKYTGKNSSQTEACVEKLLEVDTPGM
jgi:predicted acylesterase/phospholipase RssA